MYAKAHDTLNTDSQIRQMVQSPRVWSQCFVNPKPGVNFNGLTNLGMPSIRDCADCRFHKMYSTSLEPCPSNQYVNSLTVDDQTLWNGMTM